MLVETILIRLIWCAFFVTELTNDLNCLVDSSLFFFLSPDWIHEMVCMYMNTFFVHVTVLEQFMNKVHETFFHEHYMYRYPFHEHYMYIQLFMLHELYIITWYWFHELSSCTYFSWINYSWITWTFVTWQCCSCIEVHERLFHEQLVLGATVHEYHEYCNSSLLFRY